MQPCCSDWTDWSKPGRSAIAARWFKKPWPKKSAAWTKARSRASAPSSTANPSRRWPMKDSPPKFPHGPNIKRRHLLGRPRPDQGARAGWPTPGAGLEQRHFQPALRHGDCDGADQPAATRGISPHAGIGRREPAEKILGENQPDTHVVNRAIEPENRTGQTGRSGTGHHGTEPNRRSIAKTGKGSAGGPPAASGDTPAAKNFKYFLEETETFGFNRHCSDRRIM